jgi:hypothetical protein
MKSYNLPSDSRYVQPTVQQPADTDPLALLSANKRELLTTKIKTLLEQLEERQNIHEHTVRQIQQDELACDTAVLQRRSIHDYDGAQKIELTQLLALQRECREETVRCFRDAAMLRRDLLDAVLEYKAAQQNDEFVNSL